ncbi:hypothetical protein P781_16970 [Vibrio mimicus CAIM 1883]|nr:hypothetical protein P781_16970 [Vibrio mimicus CAIM 1883]
MQNPLDRMPRSHKNVNVFTFIADNFRVPLGRARISRWATLASAVWELRLATN